MDPSVVLTQPDSTAFAHCAAAGKARRGVPGAVPNPKGKAEAVPIEGSFSFLCLHAAVALTPLLPKAHSLLLTSGTLSPVAPLVAELGLGTKATPQISTPLLEVGPGNKAGLHKGGLHSPAQPGVPAMHPTASKESQASDYSPIKSETGHELRHFGQAEGNQQLSSQHQSDQCETQPHQHQEGQLPLGQHQSHPGHHPDTCEGSTLQQAVQQLPASDCAGEHKQSTQGAGLHDMEISCVSCPPGNLDQSAAKQSAKQDSASLQISLLPSQGHVSPVPQSSAASPTKRQSSDHQLCTKQPSDASSPPVAVRSQYASLHRGVELVSAPHHHTLPSRLLPLSISMAPNVNGQLVKLDSAYERRQDAGNSPHCRSVCLPVHLCCMN